MNDYLMSRYNNNFALLKQRLEELKNSIPGKAKAKEKKKIVYNNAKILYSILLHFFNNDYNEITDQEEKRCLKSIILINYLSKFKDLLNQRKKNKKKVNHTQKKLLLQE